MRDLDLPRGDERELVVDRERVYEHEPLFAEADDPLLQVGLAGDRGGDRVERAEALSVGPKGGFGPVAEVEAVLEEACGKV
jgi:hypothetical protein